MSGVAATLRELARQVLLARAGPIPEARGRSGLLVVAPHPDDETLGCGARIASARRAGVPVTIVVATDGAASHGDAVPDPAILRTVRSRELMQATERLGVAPNDVIEMGLPDGRLRCHQAALVSGLVELLRERRPVEVYTTCSAEWHPDHAAASAATYEATRQLDQRPNVLEYPIWLWADWPLSRRHSLTVAMTQWLPLVVSRAVVSCAVAPVRDVKSAALDAYASQLGGPSLGPGLAMQAPVGLPADLVRRALEGPELFFCRPVMGRVAVHSSG